MAEFTEKYIDPLKDLGFEKLFKTAEIARLTPDQVRSYEDSLKYCRDLKNSLDTAREEGLLEGIKKGIEKEKLKVAKNALKMGLSIDDIVNLTGLSRQAIEQLKTNEG